MVIPAVRRALLLVVFSLAPASACGDDAPMQALSPPPDIAQHVTGAAVAALGPDGYFPDVEPAPRERPIISRARARELALGYVNTYGQFLKDAWEERHGGRINVHALRAAPRVYYAESPYGAFPEGPYHPAFRRGFGPFYLVTLADGNVPVLVVAVSAFNTDVRLDERGQVHETARGGNEFKSAAVPRAPGEYRPIGPEEAVERAGRMSGARAVAPPELLLRAGWHPAAAFWKVPLERAVRARVGKASQAVMVDVLYVDSEGRSFVPSADQPEAEVRDVVVGPPWGPEARTIPARIPVAPGRATRFEEAAVEPL